MAYLKIFPIKVTDKKALDYITNPDKTNEKLLVSSFCCSPETADLEFHNHIIFNAASFSEQSSQICPSQRDNVQL